MQPNPLAVHMAGYDGSDGEDELFAEAAAIVAMRQEDGLAFGADADEEDYALAADVSLPAQAAPPRRLTAVHTARADELQPPPLGTKWTWEFSRIGADGADAGPRAIVEEFELQDGKYVREYSSVHVQRANTQGRHKHYNQPERSGQLNAYLEALKNDAVTTEHVKVGKRLIITEQNCSV